MLPGPNGEELYDQSLAEPEVMARMVFEHLAAHQEAFFNNLLPQDPTDRDAAQLYELLLGKFSFESLFNGSHYPVVVHCENEVTPRDNFYLSISKLP